jgi:hypothetical protein
VSTLNSPGYQPYGVKYAPGGTNEIVSSPGGYLFGGQSVQYAPGYSAYVADPVVVYPHYNDNSVEQTRRMFLSDQARALDTQRLMAAAGYGSADDVDGLWSTETAANVAKAMSDANMMYMSLSDYLMVKAGYKSARDAQKNGGGAGSGPRTMTSVNRSVRLTSRATAQALLKQTLANELGREPTSAEVARFVSALNKDEKANPTITTSTTTSNGSSSSTSTTTKESQIDPTSEAETYAETVSPDEAHRYQSGNYYDVIARMVGGA